MPTVAEQGSCEVRGDRLSCRFRVRSDSDAYVRGSRPLARGESFVEPFVLPVGHGHRPRDDEEYDDRDAHRFEVEVREGIPKGAGEAHSRREEGENLDPANAEGDDYGNDRHGEIVVDFADRVDERP